MKLVVLVVHMFLYGGIQEEASFIYPTMEECMREKAKKEVQLVDFPIERVEAVCEMQDPRPPALAECLPLVPRGTCEGN